MSTITEEISVLDGITAMIIKIMRGSKAQISTTDTLISINVNNNQAILVDFAGAPVLLITSNYPSVVQHSYNLNDPSAMDRLLECIKVLASVMSSYVAPSPVNLGDMYKTQKKKWVEQEAWADWIWRQDDSITWTGKTGNPPAKYITGDMLYQPKSDWYMSVAQDANTLKSHLSTGHVTWSSNVTHNK